MKVREGLLEKRRKDRAVNATNARVSIESFHEDPETNCGSGGQTHLIGHGMTQW
jgi:hypothetical protein